MQKVTPRILSGFMELLPTEQFVFNKMKDCLRDIFTSSGFLPIETPVLELSDILLAKAGGETEKQIYRFQKGDNDLCMRFDLTVPLARYVAMHQADLVFPFKRYQIDKVFRGERPQKGRFREFYQCDADIIGFDSLPIAYDAECISLSARFYKKLGIDVDICVSNRKLLAGIIEELGLIAKHSEILIILDKIDKIGKDSVSTMLTELGVSDKDIDKLLHFMAITGSNEEIVTQLRSFSSNPAYLCGIEELQTVFEHLNYLGTDKESTKIKLNIIRGLDYYTGTVFETKIKGRPELSSVGGGGRYENLSSYYTSSKLPGVGISFGLTRLFDLLKKENMLPKFEQSPIKCAILPLSQNETAFAMDLYQDLFNNDIPSIMLYPDKSVKNRLNVCNKSNIPFVILVGDSEVQANEYSLKDMRNGTQSAINKQELIKFIKNCD